MERGVLGSQSREPDDGRDDGRLVELPNHSFAVLNILECSFVNYIMSHPLLHSAISSSPVIAGFNAQLPGADLPPDSFEVTSLLESLPGSSVECSSNHP